MIGETKAGYTSLRPDMTEFDDAVASWRHKPFPPGGRTTEALYELRGDLQVADNWVAEAVIPFVDHGQRLPENIDVIARLAELRARGVELARAGNDDDTRVADAYLDFIALLLRVYEGFIAQGQAGKANP